MSDLQTKFDAAEEGFELNYGDFARFYGGLIPLIGMPSGQVLKGMLEEHTRRDDSMVAFRTGNYNILTCVGSHVIDTRTHTHAHTRTHTRTRTHAHTHTHTEAPARRLAIRSVRDLKGWPGKIPLSNL